MEITLFTVFYVLTVYLFCFEVTYEFVLIPLLEQAHLHSA